MRYLKYAGLLGLLLFVFSGSTHAQVRVAVGIGGPVYYSSAPVCSYGYYDYYPYACAPYGYYGPDWFVNGIFIGAGPWFHGYYGRGYYSRPWAYYRHGYYGRPYYGRGGYVGRGYVGRSSYGGYSHGFAGRPGPGFRGGASGGFHGGSGHGSARFHGGRR